MFNQMMNNNNNAMMGGVQYNNIQAKMTQPLTKDEIALLQNQGNQKLVVNEIDFTRSKCTHKLNGQLTLSENMDGSHTCSICGCTFNLIDEDPTVIEQMTAKMIDVLQSIKTYYLDMPNNYAEEFFVLIPLLQNTPELYRIALHRFARHENANMVNQNYGTHGFNLYNSLTSNPMGMGGMPQTMMNPAMMNNGYQNPAMMNQMNGYQNPAMNPMVDPMMNNGYQNPVMMNQMNGFTGQMMPQTPQVPGQQPIMNNNGFQQTTAQPVANNNTTNQNATVSKTTEHKL